MDEEIILEHDEATGRTLSWIPAGFDPHRDHPVIPASYVETLPPPAPPRPRVEPTAAPGIAPPSGPSLGRKALNLVRALWQHARAGFPRAAPTLADSRLAICRANRCGHYAQGDRCHHSGCGCYLAYKVTMGDQACPVGLWGPVVRTTDDDR